MSGIIFGLIWFIVPIAALFAASQSGQALRVEKRLPPHHAAEGFRNVYISQDGRFWDFWRWKLGLGPEEESALPPEEVPPYEPRLATPDLNQLHHPDPQKIQVTWIGHATFLIQTAGVNLLTDPMFSDRASPLSFAGPKRLVPPGVAFESLPPIHAALISHNHYDHLDLNTVTGLGKTVKFFVPLGLAQWFRDSDLPQVQELDWWQTASLGDLRLHCVPAQHFSMRTLFNRDRSLWCGWVLETPAGKIYFSGDTGYSPHFKEIGKRLGPMRLSLIHIGGYQPRWFMRPMHINPEEAVSVHRDVRSQKSIGMHWGTFALTDEPPGEPPLFLEKVLSRAEIPRDRFVVLSFGETKVFAKK
ncbi:MAG: MBL fold metallo-hydrolase [Deltaproteobacteria bacterium]|nr:MBL fold metallo-hydrolase [Deltaproteobacteria bacterium]